MDTVNTQYIMVACVDCHFGDPNGFKEREIREALGIEHFVYAPRTAGGGLAPIVDDIDRAWFINQITKLVNGPIFQRRDEMPADEVVIIATVHRSCGGLADAIGDSFGHDHELIELEGRLLGGYRDLLNQLEEQGLRIPVRAIGLILEHNGALIRNADGTVEEIELSREALEHELVSS